MVQTRASYRRWVEERDNNYNSQQSDTTMFGGSSQASNHSYSGNQEQCEECSQRGEDECNRHRSSDDSPYSERVVSYRRRKPRR